MRAELSIPEAMTSRLALTTATPLLLGLMLLAALSRLLPHPPNVTPVIALALFAGAAFGHRGLAIALTLGAMLIADTLLGWHSSMLAVYAALALVAILGGRLTLTSSWQRIGGHGLAGAVLFFVLSNLAVWLGSGLYPPTVAGLVECYVMAIPFFGNTLLGTALYGAALFALGRRIAEPRALGAVSA